MATDQYGNTISDVPGQSASGLDYYNTPQWQQAQAANNVLQTTTNFNRAMEGTPLAGLANQLQAPAIQNYTQMTSQMPQMLTGGQDYRPSTMTFQPQSTFSAGGVPMTMAGQDEPLGGNRLLSSFGSLTPQSYRELTNYLGGGGQLSGMQTQPFGGGTLYNGLPLNYWLTGSIDPGQKQALQQAGLWNEQWNTIPTQSLGQQGFSQNPQGTWGYNYPNYNPGTVTNINTTGNAIGGPAPNFNEGTSPKDMIAQLMNYSLGLGQAGAQQFGGLRDALNELYQFNRNQLANRAAFQDQFAQQQIGSIRDAIAQGMGMQTGLPPQALAALQGQAIEAVPERFDRLGEQMRSALLRRGALGGEMPASAGDYLREIGGLEQAKESERARGLRETAFANEAARQQNRQAAFQAAQLQSGLLGQGAEIYNPLGWQAAAQGNLSNLLNTILGQTGTQFQGANLAGNLLGQRVSLEQEKIWPMLLSALVGSAGSNIDDIIGAVGKIFK